MALTPTMIVQKVIDTAVAHTLYSPTGSGRLQQFVFVNTDVAAKTFSLYHDIDGYDYDDSNILLKDQSIASDGRFVFDEPILFNTAGKIGIDVETADVITVTGYAWVDA